MNYTNIANILTDIESKFVEHKTMTFDEAIEFCKNLDFAGYNDWRLPTIQELLTIKNYKLQNIDLTIFENFQSSWYWSSSDNIDRAWDVNMGSCGMSSYYKTANYYVWPVRVGKFDYLGNLIINNLKENEPLFIDNNDGTITDNRTGLMWTK